MCIGCIIKHKLYGIGKIIYYEKDHIDNLDFLVEFIKVQSFFHSGNSSKVEGKRGHCYWCRRRDFVFSNNNSIEYLLLNRGK